MKFTYANVIQQKFPPESFLGRINRGSWQELSDAWMVSEFSAGAEILGVEETSSDVRFILVGHARASQYSDSGREVSLIDLQKGDLFGEFAAIDNAPRSATVVAMADSIIATLPARRFRDLLQGNTDLSFALTGILVTKLRSLTERIADFNALNADQRVRREILRRAEPFARNGSASIPDFPTQANLATFVFTNRETVSREMGRMKKRGLCSRVSGNLVIPDLAALEDYIAEQDDLRT
ncbi:Crp/Fnr family transcriptional regulator [Oceanomicrobium pacificus]|uniref:Cyclic nucleotide-binding domain-containing protein n=1 Tax=Oceanomicrobium pacificus TaxID=2692916 RepID=A0A6B0TZ26_9RHOB|nr:Crp/Fnr family transcriptional regulator [Oceanomicrobium pacificus]MXU66522.1 cyclic nucleotide-binding domain-containing protein [Oceanomicrobium pacificus]